MVAVLTVIFEKLLLLITSYTEVAVEHTRAPLAEALLNKSSNGITVNILISCRGNCHVITNKSDIARSIYIQIGKCIITNVL
jgi:hypothetical protein